MDKNVKRTIVIEVYDNNSFNVKVGDKETEQLYYEELLGIVSALTMPKSKPCLQWLKTPEEREAMRNSWLYRDESNK